MKLVGAVQIPHPQRMEIKFPTPWKTVIIKFPPPRDGKGVKCPGFARGGGGMLKLQFDRYITLQIHNTTALPTYPHTHKKLHVRLVQPRRQPQRLVLYNSMTVSQKLSKPGASEHNFGATGHTSTFGWKLAD